MTDRREEALRGLRPYIERARRFSGWSFGDVRQTPLEPGPPWDYEAIARACARDAASVVDLGTGGGEVLSRIVAGPAARVVATEEWDVNATVARERLTPLGVPVVRADSLRLPFAAASFDVVLDRHEALEPAEVVRVLRPGGRAVTQQVGRRNWHEVRAFFPRMTVWADHYTTYQRGFRAAGLSVSAREHERRMAYATLGDVAFMLLVAPWDIPDFDPAAEIDALLALQDAHGGEHGIVLTEHRYLIEAVKPA